MKNLIGGSQLKLFEDDRDLRKKERTSPTIDVWELSNKKLHNQSLTEKNINVASLFKQANIIKRTLPKSQSESCSQLFSQITQVKPKQKSFSSADLASKSWRQYKQQTRVTKPRSFKDPHSNFSTPLITQLKQSVSNVNHTVRVSKLKKQFDILIRIKSIKKLSDHELLVIPSIKNTELKYVLHIEGKKRFNDEMICFHQGWKLAIYSKSTVKLSKNTYWCLSWEFIK